MVSLFRSGRYGRPPYPLTILTRLISSHSLRDKVLAILSATRAHATNLASFALLYKTLTILSRRKPSLVPHISSSTPPAPSYTPFLAGTVAGYLVFGRRASSINQQIVIYVFARVLLAFAKLLILAPEAGPQGFQAGYEGIGLKGGMGGWLERVCGGDREVADAWRRRVRRNTWPVFASLSWGAVMWMFQWYPELLQPSMRSSMKYLYVDCERWDGWRDWIWVNE